MKTLKYIVSTVLLLSIVFACTEEELGTTGFINSDVAPTNITAAYNITQDNTGLVTISPTGDGVSSFEVYFGDETTETISLSIGESIEHVYEEGVYNVIIKAFSLTGKETEIIQELVVSFQAPENLVATITNSVSVSKQVEVFAEADNATMYEFYSGEVNVDQPVAIANIGEAIAYQYATAGTYEVEIIAKGAAIETTSYTEIFEVTAIVQPITSAPTPPSRGDADVISIYGDAYTNLADTETFPDWGQAGQGSGWATFDLNGDEMLQYINLSYQGIQFGSSQDITNMEYLHLDIWTADLEAIKTSLINIPAIPADGSGATESEVLNNLTKDEWTSVDISISDYTDQGLTVSEILQLKFVGEPWAGGSVFIDNIYFWKTPSVIPTSILGTWKLSNVAGALGVGPAVGDISWWNCDGDCIMARDCYYDDEYIFNADGTFQNVLGSDTWVEPWQGGADTCGAPVTPHDGSVNATFIYDESSGGLTLNGQGAYLGLPKAYNGGELAAGDTVPNSISYNVTLSNNNTEMSVYIHTGTAFWQYKFVKETTVSPLEGTWKMSPEAGSLGVGPTVGDVSWWNCDGDCVVARDCYYDDEYVFNSNGTFQNVLGAESWIEPWQGGADTCGVPVAPHNGSNTTTFLYDEAAGTLTLNGQGSYIGLPKAYNGGELATGDTVPDSITYTIELSNGNTEINAYVQTGTAFWQYKLVKQ